MNYTNVEGYLLPNLTVKTTNKNINRYGILRLEYLKHHKHWLYELLLMKNELNEHLFSVSIECNEKFNILMDKYKKLLTEKNKELIQMEWVGHMNNYKMIADEIVLKENVYI